MDTSKHVENIRRLIFTLNSTPQMHALIIEGPAGWGKTSAVLSALDDSGLKAVHVGSYSTPLNLFNFLHDNFDSLVLIDDCAGLFNDQSAMAILKAATWTHGSSRVVRWGSTTSRAVAESFEFCGKLIVICNSFPSTGDAKAIKSRSFPYRIEMSVSLAKQALSAAAQDSARFRDKKKAMAVAQFLGGRLTAASLPEISYRTLRMGYELAEHNPDSWRELLANMILAPPEEDPIKLVQKLARQDLKVKEQLRHFEEATGFKRRTFFKLRRELNVSNR